MLKKISGVLKKHYLIAGFLALYFLVIGAKIVSQPSPFYDWDEAIYAQVGREMIRSHSYFVPRWMGMAWLDKPPVPSLFYGLVELFPVAPEVSTRLATVSLSCIALALLYTLSLRVTKDRLASFLTVAVTAFLPVYFQRSIALNVDVFLLIGWLGYALWYENTLASALFLMLAVLSKSLLGYFPPLMFLAYFGYRFITGQTKLAVLVKEGKKIAVQIAASSVWFIIMLALYKYPFIQYQFIDSHFKRVASSIEQHFGQRTFYITVLADQFRLLLVPAVASAAYLAFKFFKKRKEDYPVFLGLLFLPWFVFLNLTKTKIAWYIYPVLPQFALLAAYPVALFRKNAALRFGLFAVVAGLFFFATTPLASLLTQPFSTWEDHQRIALAAHKAGCAGLKVLVGNDTRTSYATLKSMDLVISTTKWWGNHPSIAYYADTPTTYLYEIGEARSYAAAAPANGCLVMEKNDEALVPPGARMEPVAAANKTYLLFKAK